MTTRTLVTTSPGTTRPPAQPDRRPRRRRGSRLGDAGMATAEYAIATLAACGFAALLVTILASGEVRSLLLGLVQRALSVV